MIPLLQVIHLKKHFRTAHGVIKAVDDLSFTIFPGETLGLVGESGSGKSTTGRALLRLEEPTDGMVLYKGHDLLRLSKRALKPWRKELQIVFQDPHASLNPRMTAGDIISEPLAIHRVGTRRERELRVIELLELVGLESSHLRRYPHEFSGGQRQRIGIARALSLNPQFLVCDEPLSSLDVSIQAQIANLLHTLQQRYHLAYLFIAHDLAMLKHIAHRIAVMYLGQLVEIAPCEVLYASPHHPYTQALLSAVPLPDPRLERARTRLLLSGDPPSPLNPPAGCAFASRCPHAQERCRSHRPPLKEVAPGHFSACVLN
jgi:oligopeptide/dipeptide ABC transporter ATP-binding protein